MAKKETIPWNKGKKMSAEHYKHWRESRNATCFASSGDKNINWKGGRILEKSGYVLVYCPGHPRVQGRSERSSRRKYVFEHILVAEKALGRCLKTGEVVHHVNGNKSDNRNKNLVICTQDYHKWLENRMANLYKQEHFS